MNSEARFLRSQAIFAEEEAYDLLKFLMTEKGLSREDKASVMEGIRSRFLFVDDYYRNWLPGAASSAVERKLYSVDEAAALLVCHGRPATPETVRRWAREGSLEAGWGRPSGGRRPQWLVSPRSLKRCLDVGLPLPRTYPNPASIMEQHTDFLDTLLPADPEA